MEQSGIKIWMANREIVGGEHFASAIVPAIEGCSCFILLLTQEAQDSSWVDKEVERAVHYRKPILPIQTEPIALNRNFELYLSTSQIVTLPCLDSQDAANQRLIGTVKDYMNGKAKRYVPRKSGGNTAWLKWALPITAGVLTVAVLFSTVLSHLFSGNGSGPSLGTLKPPAADVVDQIPERYLEEVAMLSESVPASNNILINVGEYAVPQAAKSWDCYIYSQDSRIVVGDGRRIQGLSAGTTYVVVASKTSSHMAEAYRVTVNDPSAGLKGINQIPDNLAHYIEDFKNATDGYQDVHSVSVKVGKETTVAPLFSNGSTLWSADTGITVATGAGSTIYGVSPGITYVLLKTDTGLYTAYRVVVTE